MKRFRIEVSSLLMRSEDEILTRAPEQTGPPNIPSEVYQRRWLILGAMCLCLLLVVASVSSLNTAIPTLARELQPTDTQILWIVDAYAVVFAGLLLFAGALGDRFGRKGALQIGLTIFAMASVACAWASDPNMLIALRGVMGIGAALIMPATLSIVTQVFPAHERPKAIAIWAAFAGAGGAIGPVMSGFLLAHFWYGSAFFVAAPIAIVAFTAVTALAPSSREGDSAALDPVGAVLSMAGFSALLFAIIEGPEKGWTSPLVLGGFVVAIGALSGFVIWEKRQTAPMLDMSLFSNARFSVGAMGITFTFMAMFAMFFVMSQYFQYVRGYSALKSGVAGLPFAGVMIAVSPRAVTIASKIGVRQAIVVGMGLVSVGMLLFSTVGETTPYVAIAGCLMVMAAGMATAMPSMTSGIMSAVPPHKAGVGSAVNDTTRELGGAIGIAIVGSIVTAIYRDGVRPSLGALPAPAADQVLKSVGRAQGVIAQAGLDAETGNTVLTAVRSAYVDGAHTGLRIVAVIVALTAVIVARKHPAHVDAPTSAH
jgi:EmrB/QacA subfamily drug resistance transporter